MCFRQLRRFVHNFRHDGLRRISVRRKLLVRPFIGFDIANSPHRGLQCLDVAVVAELSLVNHAHAVRDAFHFVDQMRREECRPVVHS